MLAFSNDYYGFIFRVTQSVELFCTYKKMPDKYKKDKNINEEIYKNLIFSTNSKSGQVGFFVYLLYTKANKGGNRHENCYWL